jgi:hypothetical protein
MQRNPNLALLEVTAVKLKPLLSELVFVGGCATGLLITDPGAGEIRKTFDVDVIAEISSYIEYTEFSERLRPLGFAEDSREGAPICRWQSDQIMLDVMPLDEKVLGFSNRWYRGMRLKTLLSRTVLSSARSHRHTSSEPKSKPSVAGVRTTTSAAMTLKI